ncbi:MAG: hypothetical protein PHV34_08965 [Verrucomicrobiae bacterium]|nr:hypothetical protein [Verrucomicrobiae bacterium]
MNLAEKLAACYLRLNGFLLLPHFTVFGGERHNHVDLVGLRARNSKESIGNFPFPTDDRLFKEFDQLCGGSSRSKTFGVIGEVKSNEESDVISREHFDYIRRFLGEFPIYRIVFRDSEDAIVRKDDAIEVGLRAAGCWILECIHKMDNILKLTKTGSWTLSESFLSDILLLRKYGLMPNACQNHSERERQPQP